MAKAGKKSKKNTPAKPAKKSQNNSALAEIIEQPKVLLALTGLLFLFLIFMYKPVVFDGLDGNGGDVLSNIGNTKQLKQIETETGVKPLWNPFMFAGTPVYHRHNAISYSVDSLIWQLDSLINWRIWYLMLAAVGMFLLTRYLGLSPLASIAVSLGFLLLPHFHALLVVGHYAKFRAIAWMPFVMLTFMMLLKRRDILSALLFTAAFALQLRTQHYQIVFYTILLLTFVGLPPYIAMIKEKKWPEFIRTNGLFLASMLLVVLIVVQPLFITRDYAPYSTRGGNSVSLNSNETEADKKGVGLDYATRWSYSLSEFWNIIIPRFHGGVSSEVYTGDAVPQFKNQVIPSYWGDMPFTQSLEYMGVILVFLALIGVLFRWRETTVKSLVFLTILALLMSLGKHFEPFYKLFFDYVPFFDQFRVPMMILTLVNVTLAILAAYGLDALLRTDLSDKNAQKSLYLLTGSFLAILILPLLIGSSLTLSQTGEVQRYAGQYGQQAQDVVNLLRKARLDILQTSTMRTILFFLLGAGLILSAMRGWIKKEIAVLGIILAIGLDMGLISTDYLQGRFSDPIQEETRTYGENNLDRMVKQDKSLYRVLPPLRLLPSNSRYTYHFQNIGGYSAAKLQTIMDLIENNIARPSAKGLAFNLPVVSMLNGKYIFANQELSHPAMNLMGKLESQRLFLYRNEAVLPRTFFVSNFKVLSDGVERLTYMNRSDFNPSVLALLEKEPSSSVNAPDSSASAEVTLFEPDKIVIETSNSQTSLLVLSEVYYPKGWSATLEDGSEVEILKTNHILRSMVIPGGKHTVTMEFRPSIYVDGVNASYAGWLIVLVGLAFFGFQRYKEGD
ncbi:MAG: hypothetical protein ACRBF0_11925 [Calditrichia bacterium]